MGSKAGWKKIASEAVYNCPWFKIRKDQVEISSEKVITYSYMDHAGSVFVVPITHDGEIVLIHSYRYTVDDWCWGVPSGGIQDKANKSLEQCAREEMFEEAGCVGGELTNLGWYYSAFGILSLKAHIFLAQGVDLGQNEPEPGESIDEIKKVPLSEVHDWIRTGRIRDGESVMAIYLAEAALKRGG